MNELLELAIRAHGGLDRWHEVRSIDADVSITGAIWYLKGKPDILKNVAMTVDTTRERLDTVFVGQDKRSTFEPDRVVIERNDGTVIEERDDPEASFDDLRRDSPWDDIQVAYFSGEAIWTYLNTPFLFARDDFGTEEIAPIDVDGEHWRRLLVTFPDSVKSHTRQQIFCFGPDGLLRRHDYTVDILAGGTGLNYASDYLDVDGIIVPTRRRVFAYQGDYQLVKDPLLVAVDLNNVSLN